MCALPGSGKDYWVTHHCKDLNVISLDAIRQEMRVSPLDKKGTGRVVQAAKLQAKKYLAKRTDFVWSATNITTLMREQLIQLFISYGAYVKIIYVEVPYKQLKKQNRNREHVVPSNVIEKMLKKLEVPSLHEAHEVLYI